MKQYKVQEGLRECASSPYFQQSGVCSFQSTIGDSSPLPLLLRIDGNVQASWRLGEELSMRRVDV